MLTKIWNNQLHKHLGESCHWFNPKTGEIRKGLFELLLGMILDIKGVLKGRFPLGIYIFTWKYNKEGM